MTEHQFNILRQENAALRAALEQFMTQTNTSLQNLQKAVADNTTATTNAVGALNNSTPNAAVDQATAQINTNNQALAGATPAPVAPAPAPAAPPAA